MLKKILAVFMACVLTLGVLGVAVFAEDEPAEPEYIPVEHKIEAIVEAIESGDEYYLMPTDTIVLPVPAQNDEDPAAQEDGDTPAESAIADVLIVEYFPGDDAESFNGMTKFTDMQKSGYAVKGLGDYTDYAYKGITRNTNYAIDFQNVKGYAFKRWRVTSIYSGKEFSRVTVEAEWDVPALSGWAGFIAMRRAYIKTFIDYMIVYISGLLSRIASFLV